MATRTRSKGSQSETASGRGESRSDRSNGSAFRWGGGQTGVLAAAAVAGAAVGLAANYGRKLLVQGMGAAGDWADALAAEHAAALAIFDKLEATTDEQTWVRSHLLMKLKYALDKHAAEEENVIYPALRESNSAQEADALNSEHGYVKTYLYELETMANDSPEWLARIRDFRSMIQDHMRTEEDEVFPRLRGKLSEEQNTKLSAMMNKEGLKMT